MGQVLCRTMMGNVFSNPHNSPVRRTVWVKTNVQMSKLWLREVIGNLLKVTLNLNPDNHKDHVDSCTSDAFLSAIIKTIIIILFWRKGGPDCVLDVYLVFPVQPELDSPPFPWLIIWCWFRNWPTSTWVSKIETSKRPLTHPSLCLTHRILFVPLSWSFPFQCYCPHWSFGLLQ